MFVATAQAGDADMAARIARHRAERPGQWQTVEEPFDLVARVAGLGDGIDAVVVDCLTLWVANRLLRGDGEDAIVADAEALAAIARGGAHDLTIVSNEVGEGVHPGTTAGLRFRDLLGIVNQRVAAACGRVVLMVAGLPLTVKDTAPGHDLTVQAP
jgi:adenosyl cobinamide kinase/adenosyl cobinamide phosphate guanylyltransferase